MRMLHCPARSPLSASNRFPGGDRKKSNVFAASSIVSFRVATISMARNRFGRPPSNMSCVSRQRKDWITWGAYYGTRNTSSGVFATRQGGPKMERNRCRSSHDCPHPQLQGREGARRRMVGGGRPVARELAPSTHCCRSTPAASRLSERTADFRAALTSPGRVVLSRGRLRPPSGYARQLANESRADRVRFGRA
jgi:hypothetical protein